MMNYKVNDEINSVHIIENQHFKITFSSATFDQTTLIYSIIV